MRRTAAQGATGMGSRGNASPNVAPAAVTRPAAAPGEATGAANPAPGAPPQQTQPAPAQAQQPASAPPPQPVIPSAGTVVWSGHLDKNALITIDGRSASSGALEGQLPGVPVMIQVSPNNVGVAEFPSPGNDWKKVVLRGGKSQNVVVRIQWKTLQQ